MSCAPFRNTTFPSRDKVTRIEDGFDIEVLPQPYHMHAIPAPRRRCRAAAEALKASAAARSAFQRGRSASRQATSPTLASSTWPVAVRSPARSAFRCRNSSGSRRKAIASSSIRVSCAMAACGTPKPRKAPDGGECVKIARESARTFGARYGPMQCTGTRPATVGPHEAYAPVSKSPSNS